MCAGFVLTCPPGLFKRLPTMTPGFTESIVEESALAWLETLGYSVLHGPDIAIGEPATERTDPGCRDVILGGRLRHALARLNPSIARFAELEREAGEREREERIAGRIH